MKNLILILMLLCFAGVQAQAVTNVGSKWDAGDLVFYDVVAGENLLKLSATNDNVDIVQSVVFSGIQAVSVNASATTNITGSTLLIYNGATVGTANFVLPASPVNGQIVTIASKPAVTVSTVTGGTKTVNGGSTSFSANTAVGYIYSSDTGQWHKYK